MRPTFLLLVAGVTLLFRIDAASGSTTKLRTAQNLIPSTETGGTEQIARVLRYEAKNEPEGEERGVVDLAKLVGTKTKTMFDNNALATIVRLKSQFATADDAVKAFMKRNINPDAVYRWLKLYKPNNRIVKDTTKNAPEYLLWLRYAREYAVAHPDWVSKLPKGA